MSKVLRTLASIKPPKEQGYNEGTIEDAIAACPILNTYRGYGNLDDWQAGIFTALGKMYDAFVDTGDEEILTEITEETVSVADDWLTIPDNQARISTLLPETAPIIADIMKGDTSPFKTGVVVAFAAILLHVQAGMPVEEPAAPDEPEPEPEPEPAPPPAEPPPIKKRSSSKMRDFNELIEALYIAGMDVNEISLDVVRRDDRNIVTMTGRLGFSVAFSEIAKINAVFRSLTGRDLNITALGGGKDASWGVGFSHEI